MNKKISEIKLLDDDPASESFFKWHDRVAQAIHQIVSSKEKGRAIGLFGSLGSGKSTVINLLETEIQKANQEKEVLVFTFDAWTHGNDPLKRSFIESF